MGLLEQLEQEAEQKRRAAARAAAERQQGQQVWAEHLLPGMRTFDLFLQRLVAELQRLRPVSRMVAELPGYGEVVAYSDHEYRLQSRVGDGDYEISLQFGADVATAECPLVTAGNTCEVTRVAAALWQQRLFGVLHAESNDHGEATSAQFRARGRLLLRLRAVADRASGRAELHMSNLEGLRNSHRVLSPDALTPSAFEEIGRLIAWTDDGRAAMPGIEVGERRQQHRRSGIRMRAVADGGAPGRRIEDRAAAARLRPWIDSGAMPSP